MILFPPVTTGLFTLFVWYCIHKSFKMVNVE
jgi:hypothetical protein